MSKIDREKKSKSHCYPNFGTELIKTLRTFSKLSTLFLNHVLVVLDNLFILLHVKGHLVERLCVQINCCHRKAVMTTVKLNCLQFICDFIILPGVLQNVH